MLLRAGEVPGVQVWAGGLLSHEVGRAVSHHLECSVTNILAEYHGESGDNAVHRLGQHEEAIKKYIKIFIFNRLTRKITTRVLTLLNWPLLKT